VFNVGCYVVTIVSIYQYIIRQFKYVLSASDSKYLLFDIGRYKYFILLYYFPNAIEQ